VPRAKRAPPPPRSATDLGQPPANPRWKALERSAAAYKGFRPAAEVLKVVKAVPTRFVQFDHGTRVRGFPVERYTLVHGASNHGKSIWTLGLAGSFLEKDHLVLYIDAERTTPITWVDAILGEDARHPHFFALRPDSYEDTIAEVRRFLNTAREQLEKKKVPPDTCALVVVDSLRKLIPKGLLDEIMSAEQDGDDVKAGKDRRAQLQARMNAAWMDELTPMLDHAQAGMAAIAREYQDVDADQWAKKAGRDYKVGGGGSTYFEASLVVRVERAGWVEVGQGKERQVYGERLRALIRKTKVGGKADRDIPTYFHISNGNLVPAGFDRARDVLELGVELGHVARHGSWYSHGEERIAAGENNAVVALASDPARLARIEAEIRSSPAFGAEPGKFDPKTGEVFES
jgi:recombination protein RecA